MNFESKKIILIDGTGRNVRTAIIEDGNLKKEFVSNEQAMESAIFALDKICTDFSEIDGFGICTGPGSILGTRVASVAISTIATLNCANIFEWDAMQVAAYVSSQKYALKNLAITAPSRKGFVNLLILQNEEIEYSGEIKLEELSEKITKLEKTFLLNQREKVDESLDKFERIDISLTDTFEQLKIRPQLAVNCDMPPDGKSLTKREYVKWKAQAHI